jgi:hypothetical protein
MFGWCWVLFWRIFLASSVPFRNFGSSFRTPKNSLCVLCVLCGFKFLPFRVFRPFRAFRVRTILFGVVQSFVLVVRKRRLFDSLFAYGF